MKLSEIKGEKAIEIIADLIEPVAEIASSKEIKNIFPIVPKGEETPEEAALRAIKKEIPNIVKCNSKEVAKIIGILEEEDPEKLSLAQIMKGLSEMISDKAFIQLFSSAVLTEEKAPPIGESNK